MLKSSLKLAVTCATLLTSTVVMAGGPQPEPAPSREVFFAFDSSSLGAAQSGLDQMVAFSNAHPTAKIVIDGHTDLVGTDVYNVGLSMRRARTVEARLMALGVPADRLYLGIYGEQGPRRATASGDRRVTVWTTEEPLYKLVEHCLDGGIAALWNKPATAAEIDGPKATVAIARR